MKFDPLLFLGSWLAIGSVLVMALLYEAGGWRALVEELEEEQLGYPVLSAGQTAAAVLLLALVAWPIGLILLLHNRGS